jgi:sRNA-binding protein
LLKKSRDAGLKFRKEQVQMKILMLFILCLTSAALAEDFKTVSGKEYKDATITRVEPDGLVLKYKSGISKVYFTELPKEIQERFHYEPAKAAKFNAAEQAAIAQSNAKAQQEADAKEKALAEQRAKAARARQEQARREEQAQRQLPPRPIGDTMSRVGGGSGIGASSERFKDEIKPMGDASDAILALKPVTFRY